MNQTNNFDHKLIQTFFAMILKNNFFFQNKANNRK